MKIRDLALIGDQRTAAVINTTGEIVWYCPQRFDAPSVFASLLDPRGGMWRIDLPGGVPLKRRYLDDSAVLETSISIASGELTILDWMALGDDVPVGVICRRLTPCPADVCIILEPAPDYARRAPRITRQNHDISIDDNLFFYASHPAIINGRSIYVSVRQGDECWMVLSDRPLPMPSASDLERWLATTLTRWHELALRTSFRGPYEREVADSMRALRLLTYAPTGGILAAATTSLPESIGGQRNYDYRYVWSRDSAMIARAFIHAEKAGTQERRFLEFIHDSRRTSRKLPLAPAATISGETVPKQAALSMEGFSLSHPVLIGNQARLQLQMSAYGNVLLTAALIYETYHTRDHWDTMSMLADFLVEQWPEPDNGIWEETSKRQYTASKVLGACGLNAIAGFAKHPAQARHWRVAVENIRSYVAHNCMTRDGAYAAVAGGQIVDVSAALFPMWNYTAADSPAMIATIAALDRDFSARHLYRRHLELFDSRGEGAFLAGTFWVARYYVTRGDLSRARTILDAGLKYANDVGLFAEEADPDSLDMLGNLPQGFVHAAFVNAVVDLRTKLAERGAYVN